MARIKLQLGMAFYLAAISSTYAMKKDGQRNDLMAIGGADPDIPGDFTGGKYTMLEAFSFQPNSIRIPDGKGGSGDFKSCEEKNQDKDDPGAFEPGANRYQEPTKRHVGIIRDRKEKAKKDKDIPTTTEDVDDRIDAAIDASMMMSLGTCRLVIPLSESTIAKSGPFLIQDLRPASISFC